MSYGTIPYGTGLYGSAWVPPPPPPTAVQLILVPYLIPGQSVVEAGSTVNLCCEVFVDGAITTPATASLRLRTPDGKTAVYALLGVLPVTADTVPVRLRVPFTTALAGRHAWTWTVGSQGLQNEASGEFDCKKVAVP